MALAAAARRLAPLLVAAWPLHAIADEPPRAPAPSAAPAPPPPPPAPPPPAAPSAGEVAHLTVPGRADAFVVPPKGDGRLPIVLVLHPRRGDPEEECKKWAALGSRYGWVLCPAGPFGDEHARSWVNFEDSKSAIDAAVAALRAKHGDRATPAGNVIIGFSEGAFIAQALGVREPERWNRWLILAGSDKYWGKIGPELLRMQRGKITRVVMLTGDRDPVLEHTLRAGAMIRGERIPVRVVVRRGLAHEVPAARMTANYEASLRWLVEGK